MPPPGEPPTQYVPPLELPPGEPPSYPEFCCAATHASGFPPNPPFNASSTAFTFAVDGEELHSVTETTGNNGWHDFGCTTIQSPFVADGEEFAVPCQISNAKLPVPPSILGKVSSAKIAVPPSISKFVEVTLENLSSYWYDLAIDHYSCPYHSIGDREYGQQLQFQLQTGDSRKKTMLKHFSGTIQPIPTLWIAQSVHNRKRVGIHPSFLPCAIACPVFSSAAVIETESKDVLTFLGKSRFSIATYMMWIDRQPIGMLEGKGSMDEMMRDGIKMAEIGTHAKDTLLPAHSVGSLKSTPTDCLGRLAYCVASSKNVEHTMGIFSGADNVKALSCPGSKPRELIIFTYQLDPTGSMDLPPVPPDPGPTTMDIPGNEIKDMMPIDSTTMLNLATNHHGLHRLDLIDFPIGPGISPSITKVLPGMDIIIGLTYPMCTPVVTFLYKDKPPWHGGYLIAHGEMIDDSVRDLMLTCISSPINGENVEMDMSC